MKDTKQKILDTALDLFNQRGISDITLRNIAQAMGISQGNLNYHFRYKEDIISELYFELVKKLDAQLMELGVKMMSMSSLELLWESSSRTMQQMYDYRFVLVDFLKIMADIPAIKTHYIALQQQRAMQFQFFFQMLLQQGFLRNPDFEGEYERFYERLHILGDSWINTYIMFGDPERKNIAYYQSLLFEVIYPYLTEKGKQEYRRLVSEI